jgi:uncharacterized protein HemX
MEHDRRQSDSPWALALLLLLGLALAAGVAWHFQRRNAAIAAERDKAMRAMIIAEESAKENAKAKR